MYRKQGEVGFVRLGGADGSEGRAGGPHDPHPPDGQAPRFRASND